MLWLKIMRFLEGSEKGKQYKVWWSYCPVIDGVSGDPQIAGLWSTKFKELYNCCNPSTRSSLEEQLNSIITEDDLETLIVDTDTVICAIKRLKAGKSDGKSLMSDHVLYAPPTLASKLSFIYCPVVAWIYKQ